jgi:hypothetical protein
MRRGGGADRPALCTLVSRYSQADKQNTWNGSGRRVGIVILRKAWPTIAFRNFFTAVSETRQWTIA